MTDLLDVLPDFPTKKYTHLVPSLEKHLITTCDLLTLDALEIARRAQLPFKEVQRLINDTISQLHGERGFIPQDGQSTSQENTSTQANNTDKLSFHQRGHALSESWSTISTLDDNLDAALGGGIPTGYTTEITGESGAGKTQLLLTLLLSTQLPPPHGLSRPALYISTEHPLSTTRLKQILTTNPTLRSLSSSSSSSSSSSPSSPSSSLSAVFSIPTQDLESQEHILTYQVPVLVAKHNIGLIVIDSIAANFRAEADFPTSTSTGPGTVGAPQQQQQQKQKQSLAKSRAVRSADLIRTGALLRNLAQQHNCAIVVANQISDRILETPSFYNNPPPNPPSHLPPHASSQPPPHSHSQPLPPSSPISIPAHPSSSPSPFTQTTTNPSRLQPQGQLGLNLHPSDSDRSGPPSPTLLDPRLTLDHQMRFFTGWGDDVTVMGDMQKQQQLKTPSLGLAWANQIACRVALLKEEDWGRNIAGVSGAEVRDGGSAEWAPRRWRRWARVVFAAWTGSVGEGEKGVEFEIWAGGIRSLGAMNA